MRPDTHLGDVLQLGGQLDDGGGVDGARLTVVVPGCVSMGSSTSRPRLSRTNSVKIGVDSALRYRTSALFSSTSTWLCAACG